MNYIMKMLVALTIFLLTDHSAIADTVTHFRATLDHTAVIDPVVGMAPDIGISGWAEFTLTEPIGSGSPTLSYEIHLNGVDVDQLQTPTLNDNLFAVHIHNITSAGRFDVCLTLRELSMR